MSYLDIIASTIEASDDRDTTLKAVEANLKNFQKMLYNVNA